MDDTRDSSRSLGPVLIGLCVCALLLLAVFLGWLMRERARRFEIAATEARLQMMAAAEALHTESDVLPVRTSLPPRALEDAYEWEEEQPDGLATVIVRVGRAPLGEALRGAQVSLVSDTSAGVPVTRDAITDASGVAGFGCEPGERVREVFVPAAEERPAAWRALSHELVAGRLFGTSVLVGPGARLEGRVVDGAGRGVAGARIALACCDLEHYEREGRSLDRIALSDAEGRFAFDAVGPAYVVSASDTGAISAGILLGAVNGPETIELSDLVLVPSRSLPGLVMGEDLLPMRGAQVSARCVSSPVAGIEPWPRITTRTNSFGCFVLDPLPRTPLELEVYGPDGAHSTMHVGADAERADFGGVMLLPGGRWILGVVVDQAGAPVAGARIQVIGAGGEPTESYEDGRFVVADLSGGEGALFVDAGEGGSAWLAQIDSTLGGEEERIVRLEPRRSLAGRVVDETGAPVEGALVSLRGDRELAREGEESLTCLGLLSSERGATDAEGRFAFDKLWPGRFALEVSHPDEPDLSLHAESESGGAPLELAWDRPRLRRVVIAGEVRDAQSGAAIDEFQVAALRPTEEPESQEGRLRSFHDAAGRFQIAALPPGAYRLRVDAPGYLAGEQDLGELAEGEHASAIELVPLREVELAFQDPEGIPLSTGALTIRRLDGTELGPLDPEALDRPPGGPAGAGAAARLVDQGRVRTVLPAELLELELALPGNERLSYLLDVSAAQGAPEIFVVDLDAHTSRESAHVLVCAARQGAPDIETGWVRSLSRGQREQLAAGHALALYDGGRLELSVRDRHGALVGRAVLEPVPGGGWRSTFRLAHFADAIVSEAQLPVMQIDLPRKGFRLEARAEGFERAEITVDALGSTDLDSSRALVLRRAGE